MKNAIRNILSPILNYFDSGSEQYSYKKSHRTILKIVGSLFLFLAFISLVIAVVTLDYGAAIPFIVFFSVGFICLVVGSLGSDRAVAKIWGSN